MKNKVFISAIAFSFVLGGFIMAGCGEGDGSNAEDVKKAQQNMGESNNPNVPAIDAKNEEFGKGAGPKKGGGQ